MRIIEINDSIECLWSSVVKACKADAKYTLENVIINGSFNIDEINSNFINIHKEEAEKWRRVTKPEDLIINHGEYINKGRGNYKEELGINFIIKELKNKNCGNRACYSLINMEDIVGSGDQAIPSFMILQFSFSNYDSERLLVSAYFRALEVNEFLPINLAEICLNISEIKEKFPNIKIFELNLFAFRAQYIKDFNCLRQSKLDILKSTDMVKYFMKDTSKIIEALKDKNMMIESVIITKGIKNLMEAIESVDDEDLNNKDNIKRKLAEVFEAMESIKKMRENTSIQDAIKKETDELKDNIKELIKLMEA